MLSGASNLPLLLDYPWGGGLGPGSFSYHFCWCLALHLAAVAVVMQSSLILLNYTWRP